MSCDRKIGPFPCCSVVQGDCLELMKQLPDGCVDGVITDPPYGIGYNPTRSQSSAASGSRKALAKVTGDDRPFDPEPFLRIAPKVVLWGANNYSDKLPRSNGWMVWDKRQGGTLFAGFVASDVELAWSNLCGRTMMFSHAWCGHYRDSERDLFVHPTQKPTALMVWCIEKAEDCDTILDPFAGSGTTLVAAAKLGRHFLGFEISPEYCEIARKRLALVEAQPTLFEKKPEQTELGL